MYHFSAQIASVSNVILILLIRLTSYLIYHIVAGLYVVKHYSGKTLKMASDEAGKYGTVLSNNVENVIRKY